MRAGVPFAVPLSADGRRARAVAARRPLRRALQGHVMVDSSWAMAMTEDGRFDRWFMFGHTASLYVGWSLGTAAGAVAGSALADARTLGVDAVFPAFFLATLVGELRDPHGRAVALAGAAIALALVPFAPPGVPVLATSVAALARLHRRMARP